MVEQSMPQKVPSRFSRQRLARPSQSTSALQGLQRALSGGMQICATSEPELCTSRHIQPSMGQGPLQATVQRLPSRVGTQ